MVGGQRIRFGTLEVKTERKITPNTVGTFRQMVLESLRWIKYDGLASKIECVVEQQGRNTIAYCVTVVRPNGNTLEIQEVWNGV